MRVSLEKFLKSGYVGDIAMGMSRGSVLAIVGEPAEYHRGSNLKNSEIWINGPLTIFFKDNTVDQLGLYFQTEYETNENISFIGWFPERKTTLTEISEYMKAHEIEFSISGRGLKTENGVVVISQSKRVNSIIYPDLSKRLKNA